MLQSDSQGLKSREEFKQEFEIKSGELLKEDQLEQKKTFKLKSMINKKYHVVKMY